MAEPSMTKYVRSLVAVLQEVVPGLEYYCATVVHEVQRTTTLYLVGVNSEKAVVGGYELRNCSATSDLYEDGVKVAGFFQRAMKQENPLFSQPAIQRLWENEWMNEKLFQRVDTI